MKNIYYHIIDREGNVVFSSTYLMSMIGRAGLCLIENDDSPSIYNINTHQECALPTHIDGKRVVYRVDWNYPIENTIVGYLIEKANSKWQRNLLNQEYTPNGMRCIASVVLDSEFHPRFTPLPLCIHPYKGEWTLAENYNKGLLVLDCLGKIIHKFSHIWRLKHRFYDDEGKLAELIVYKSDEKNAPLYRFTSMI